MSARSERPFCLVLLSVAVLLAAAPARAEWVAGGYLGGAHTATAPLTVAQPPAATDVAFSGVPYRGESFRPPVYYGYRLAYFARRESWWGIEAEFIHLKAYADTAARTRAAGTHHGVLIDADMRIDAIVNRFSISHGLNFVLVNAVLRRDLGAPAGARRRFSLAGRVGVGRTIPHAESTIDGIAQEEAYAWGAVGFHAAAGASVRVWRGVSVILEYKFTRTRQTVDVDRGEARGVFASHHGVAGAAVAF